ncbi:MAG: hypothetical protein H6842_05425 [Rhodospirillaceae bacterium]|nr:hypothetical protein [Rhodospirillaceae bacterium]
MVQTAAEREAKLRALAESEGYDTVDELLQAASFDSVIPGICVHCDYTTEVEPDQRQGWCEACGRSSVQSTLVLAGLI